MDVKLIDILVQELPKRGGWPEGADHIATNGYWRVFAYWVGSSLKGRDLNIVSDAEGYVTRDQYESALAARKPEWDGEGLPPVGCECEGKQLAQLTWNKFKVVAIENGHVFGFWNDNVSTGLDSRLWEFRPIRSEADKKKEALLSQIANAIIGDVPDTGMASAAMYAERIYDAIKSGKIVIN